MPSRRLTTEQTRCIISRDARSRIQASQGSKIRVAPAWVTRRGPGDPAAPPRDEAAGLSRMAAVVDSELGESESESCRSPRRRGNLRSMTPADEEPSAPAPPRDEGLVHRRYASAWRLDFESQRSEPLRQPAGPWRQAWSSSATMRLPGGGCCDTTHLRSSVRTPAVVWQWSSIKYRSAPSWWLPTASNRIAPGG